MKTPTPDYGGGSILNLSSSLFDFIGAGSTYPRLKGELDLVQGKRILLILVDGLGYTYLSKIYLTTDDASWIGKVGRITSTFPSVTATVLTTLSTGVPPGIHGVLGTIMYVREVGGLVNTLSMSAVQDSRRSGLKEAGYDLRYLFYGGPTLFEEAKNRGYKSTVLVPKGLTGGLSDLIYRGADVKEYVAMYDGFVAASKALEESHIVYLYIPHLDSIGHEYGPDSMEYRVSLVETMHTLGRLIKHIPQSVAVILVSDHGQVQVNQGDVVNLRSMVNLMDSLLMPPYGEPRALQLKLAPWSSEGDVKSMFGSMGRRLAILSSGEVADMLGGVSQHTARMMGDLWVIPQDSTALIYLYRLNDDKVAKFKGHHAGLSAEELEVPLVIINT